MQPIKLNDQVIYRIPQPRTRTNLLKMGSVVALNANGTEATVVFPSDNSKMTLSVDKLENVQSRFSGRARVDSFAARRGII